MNLRQLRYFQVLAKKQHYTDTSDYFSISQPSLSHAISELEKEIGIKLFQKKGRNVELTKEGEQYLSYVNQALSSLSEGEQFIKELTSISHGHIGLAYVYSLSMNFIPHLVKSFIDKPKYQNISFSFYEDLTNTIIEGLRSKKYDIAICSHIVDVADIHFECLTKHELVFIISNEHPLSKKKKIDMKDIIGEPLISYTKRSGMRTLLDAMFVDAGLEPNIVCEVESENSMIGLASINYGIGIMPRVPVPENGNVTLIPLPKNYQRREIYVATVKNRPLLPATQKFYRFLLDNGKHILQK